MNLIKSGAPFGKWRMLIPRFAWVLRFGAVGPEGAQETDPLCPWGYREGEEANPAFLLLVTQFYSQQLSILPPPFCPQCPCVERDSRVPGAQCCGTVLVSVVLLVHPSLLLPPALAKCLPVYPALLRPCPGASAGSWLPAESLVNRLCHLSPSHSSLPSHPLFKITTNQPV